MASLKLEDCHFSHFIVFFPSLMDQNSKQTDIIWEGFPQVAVTKKGYVFY